MSLKGWWMPRFAAWWLGEDRLQGVRDRAEKKRRRQGRPHRVRWYHRVDDPHSHLLAQALPSFLERYDVELEGVTVAPPSLDAVSDPDAWATWAHNDAREVAARTLCDGRPLDMPPGPCAGIEAAHGALEASDDYLTTALELGAAAWRGEALDGPGPAAGRLEANRRLLQERGHYLSGMLEYEGEWYWGLDRLGWLEERLEALGAGSGSSLSRRSAGRAASSRTLELWGSVRSPYTYLALERVFEMVERRGAQLRLRPILPMVMRGVPAPLVKRMYIVSDAKRVALREGIPFGAICDPMGAGVERALAWLPRARDEGVEGALLLAAMRGAWAEGVELATDAGLRRVVESVGLSWDPAQVKDERWRAEVETNREELGKMGLWGVPSYRLGDYTGWGQDRIWVLDDLLSS